MSGKGAETKLEYLIHAMGEYALPESFAANLYLPADIKDAVAWFAVRIQKAERERVMKIIESEFREFADEIKRRMLEGK